jgi:hypothetical protein
MTPIEQTDLPWTVSDKDERALMAKMLPHMKAAIDEGDRPDMRNERMGTAVTLTMDFKGRTDDRGDGHEREERYVVEMHLHPCLIEGEGPEHPWDATPKAKAGAMLRVVAKLASARIVKRTMTRMSNDDPDLVLDAVRLEEETMPRVDRGLCDAVLRAAGPLGTGGLCVFSSNGSRAAQRYAVDQSGRHCSPGVVVVDLTTNGGSWLDTNHVFIDSECIDVDLPNPDPMTRMRMERDAEARKGRP